MVRGWCCFLYITRNGALRHRPQKGLGSEASVARPSRRRSAMESLPLLYR